MQYRRDFWWWLKIVKMIAWCNIFTQHDFDRKTRFIDDSLESFCKTWWNDCSQVLFFFLQDLFINFWNKIFVIDLILILSRLIDNCLILEIILDILVIEIKIIINIIINSNVMIDFKKLLSKVNKKKRNIRRARRYTSFITRMLAAIFFMFIMTIRKSLSRKVLLKSWKMYW